MLSRIKEFRRGANNSLRERYLSGNELSITKFLYCITQEISRADASSQGWHDYRPFGEEISPVAGGCHMVQGYSAGDKLKQKFTGYERDGETELDYAQARYFASQQGRFTGPDRS